MRPERAGGRGRQRLRRRRSHCGERRRGPRWGGGSPRKEEAGKQRRRAVVGVHCERRRRRGGDGRRGSEGSPRWEAGAVVVVQQRGRHGVRGPYGMWRGARGEWRARVHPRAGKKARKKPKKGARTQSPLSMGDHLQQTDDANGNPCPPWAPHRSWMQKVTQGTLFWQCGDPAVGNDHPYYDAGGAP